jgi:hypothetical protein
MCRLGRVFEIREMVRVCESVILWSIRFSGGRRGRPAQCYGATSFFAVVATVLDGV